MNLSYSIVKVYGMPVDTELTEFIIDSSNDVDSLPTDIADGSSAYTKDLSKIYLLKDGTWTEVG